MNDNTTEINKDNFEKFKETHKQSLDRLFKKIEDLVKSYRLSKEENNNFKEAIKDLTNKITDLKLQLSKSNSDLVFKDKEISDLKNLLLDSNNNKLSVQDKQNLKSRISELISRIDVHLEQYEDEKKDYEF
jgi:septal ring factor EnvC (AmiA/AmiB activator)